MKFRQVLMGAAFAATVAAAGTASATTVSVNALSGPWDPTIAGNPAYGVGDNTAPTSLAVNAGDHITISYLSGLTSAFAGLPASVDAQGYIGSDFGSGMGLSGMGTSGTFFPSHAIDPGNSGPDIFLAALIGDFVNSSGVVLDEFAPGNGPFTIDAPTGAVALQLGLNDDIFGDNSGALSIGVTGSTVAAVPEPASWAMMLVGFGGLGVAMRSSRRAKAAAATA
jgi:PEP-CTERM motif